MKEEPTKTKRRKLGGDEIRAEYDFSKAVRGKYHKRVLASTNIIVLDPDIAENFKNLHVVNEARCPMTEDKLNEIIIRELNRFHLSAEPLQRRNNSQTVDLVIKDERNTYFIEAKQRDRSEEIETSVQGINVDKSVALTPVPISYRNALSSTIKDGVKQLDDTATNDSQFRLLWLHAGEHDAATDRLQAEATLCGEMRLLDQDGTVHSCYFFTESAFFTYRKELDGAFVTDLIEWFFVLNPYSPRYEALRRSNLTISLGKGVYDPVQLEQEGKLLIADCTCNRKDVNAVLSYVSNKYSKSFKPIELHRFGMYLRVT